MADQMFNFSHRYHRKETVSLCMHVIRIGQQMSPEGCVPCVCRPSWTRVYFSHFNIYVIVLDWMYETKLAILISKKKATAVHYPKYHFNTTYNKMHKVPFTDTSYQRPSFAELLECFRTLVAFAFVKSLILKNV